MLLYKILMEIYNSNWNKIQLESKVKSQKYMLKDKKQSCTKKEST